MPYWASRAGLDRKIQDLGLGNAEFNGEIQTLGLRIARILP